MRSLLQREKPNQLEAVLLAAEAVDLELGDHPRSADQADGDAGC
jgi:hypothetical protein